MSAARSFRFVDAVTSDLCLEARGSSLGEVFAAAAEALLAATVDRPEDVEEREERSVILCEADPELLLLRFLDELIYLRDADGLLLRPRRVRIEGEGSLRLEAELAGEPFERDRHGSACDVKAATAHGLEVKQGSDGWTARVTLDV